MLSELLSLSLCKRKLHQVVLQLQFYVTKPAFVTYDDILRKHWLVCLIASWSDRRKLLESQGWYFNSNWFVLGINLFFLVCDDRGMKNIFFWGSSEQARLKYVDPVCFVKAFGSLLVFPYKRSICIFGQDHLKFKISILRSIDICSLYFYIVKSCFCFENGNSSFERSALYKNLVTFKRI